MPDTDNQKAVVAYQVIAVLAFAAGFSWHPDVQHVLAYLAGERDDDPLPFPKTLPLTLLKR